MDPQAGSRTTPRNGTQVGLSTDTGAGPGPETKDVSWCSISDREHHVASWVPRRSSRNWTGPIRPIGRDQPSAPAFECDLCDSLWPSPEDMAAHKATDHSSGPSKGADP